MKKFLLLALSQLFAVFVFADGVPRYYELVTSADQLESGKYYVIIGIPTAEDLKSDIQYRMAYNGINLTESKGNAGSVTPNALYAQDGITPSQFSGIIDIGKDGNVAKPLKFVKNEEKSTTTSTVWNFIDESATANSQLVGVNSETSAVSDKHYLLASDETQSVNLNNNLNLWYIAFNNAGFEYIMNAGKTCYLKYDANSYGDENSLFRVYALDEKRHIMLYKEMETVTAGTSFTGHGTLYYSNKVLMVPDGVTAKTYTLGTHVVNSNKEYESERFIPANSAVVLHGTASTTYTFPVTTRHTPTRDADNILRGLDAAGSTTTGDNSDDNDYYFYKLTTKNKVASSVGFYWGSDEGAPFTSAAHKAYLAVLKTAAARIQTFLLDGGETTSINNVSLPTQENTTEWVYDLSGRRFSTSQSLPKGIYFSNGKKFVVK